MKRPLFAAALCLVALTAVRVAAGNADRTRDGYIRAEQLEGGENLLVTGQVYRKDASSVYIKSVIISDPAVRSELPEVSASGQSAQTSGQQNQIQNHAGGYRCQDYFICETEEAMEIPLGSVIMAEGIFAPFSHGTNPGEFDAAVYYRTLEIGGKLRKAQLLGKSESCWPFRESLFQLKCRLKERLYRILPEKEAAVMSALLLGDKSEMDSDTKDLYERNGILHILSISSLHITIIGMSVYKLLRRIRLPVLPAALGGSVLLLLYGCLTGFGVSACRAIGMYLIKMLGEAAGRTYDMLTALGVMGAIMVLRNPYYLESSGFLLSYASVLGIGILYPALAPEPPGFLQKAEKEKNIFAKAGDSVYQSFFVSLCITLTTLPVQLWFYYEIPVYSVFLNLFVIPLMKPMMIAGIIALGVPGLEWLSIINYGILQGYSFLCGCFDRLPFHTWNPGCPRVWQIVVYYGLLLGAAGWNYRVKQKEKFPERFSRKFIAGR
ncbi:MAG: ComEC/Rec2 family competence protein [Acetatifactor muris]|nr:ComEC/Rec2 family competence protein [Acetatifactor muris]